MTRRGFLKLVGASGAAATAAGCSRGGRDKVIPYLIPVEDIRPGVSERFATVCRECPAGCGMLASVRDGRCHMVAGNPDHPINSGGLCLRGHTALQGLYNPDRYRGPFARDDRGRLVPISWDDAKKRLDSALTSLGGRRAAWIGQMETGAFDRLVDEWLNLVSPGHIRLRYEALAYEPLRAAAARVWGKPIVPDFRIAEANTLISFGADFVETWVSNVEYTRDFSEWRRARREGRHSGRYVFVGPRLSLTGANADEWIAVRPGDERLVASAISAHLRGDSAAGDRLAGQAGVAPAALQRLAREFRAGTSLALPIGHAQQGPDATDVCEEILRLNVAAGNVGRTIIVDRPHALSGADGYRDMQSLMREMAAGRIGALFIHGANPVCSLPPSAGFADALKRVPHVISFSSYPDETASLASLVLPDHTPLESWGEYSPRPGIDGLMQPVVAPVFDTRATGDVLLASASRKGRPLSAPTFEAYLRRAHHTDDAAWKAMLGAGLASGVSGTVRVAPAAGAPSRPRAASQVVSHKEGPILQVYPSVHLYDGRTANRPWAQEVPDPTAKAVWASWAEIHPDRARSLGASDGDLLALRTGAGRIDVPARVTDGVQPDVVAVMLGQGHSQFGRYASTGVNAVALLGAESDAASGALAFQGAPVSVSKLAVRRPVTVLQTAARQTGLGLARAVSLAQLRWRRKNAGTGEPEAKTAADSLYGSRPHPKHHWGLSIDLDACVGCNACVAACYAENNVPIVGAEQCARGREMAWLRIENYADEAPLVSGLIQIRTKPEAPPTGARPLKMRFLPMLCQQCENAPCEYVCPVDATVHSDEGLNQQVYNRCVGTRYCSNNCPYKVRRFNWFNWKWQYPLDQQTNPDVTVRSKGVMEKCTFCIQRIRRTEIDARAQKRSIADGEIQTACQQACPARAITFGDLRDEGSRVAALAKDERAYRALDDLNTFPNVSYLARVRAE